MAWRGPRQTRSSNERGYGRAHQQERERWKPIVDAGLARCAQPVCLEERAGRGRRIRPGTLWHLGHNEARTAWIGPTHARCNWNDGASRGGKIIHARQYGRKAPTTATVRNSGNVGQRRVTVECQRCGERFTFTQHIGRPRKYCSTRCADAVQRQQTREWRRRSRFS